MTAKTTTISNWLVDAAQLQPGDQLNIYLGKEKGPPPPAFSDMRAALHAQYGGDTLIRIWKHGERICIFIHADEDARNRFDHRNARIVIRHGAERKEIECGFVRKLAASE